LWGNSDIKDKVMGILSWIAMGFIVGALAKLIMPGKDPGGIIVTVLLGIAGALLGGLIASKMGLGTVHALDLKSILIATGGAILILIVYRMFFSQKKS
jgi:uncharacterized membrane protein YeaQ/YmgE (transglycosylase-associated protein family)